MATTEWKTYDCVINYAQVFERNMDKGVGDNDAAAKVRSTEGQFKVTMLVTDEVKQQMIDDGIPEVSLGWSQFKEDGEGLWAYVVKRPNLSPFKDEDGEPVYFGPPRVVDWKATKEAKEAVDWDSEVNIGNGSTGKVKLSIYKNGNKRIIRLESVAVDELVEYTPQEGIKW